MRRVVVLYVVLVPERPVVELVHAMVGLGVDEASPDGYEEGWHDKHENGDVDGDHGPSPHCPVDEGREEGGARLVSAEVRVVDDVLEGVEEDDGVVFCFHLVTQGGVLLHVVVELVKVALFEEPIFVLSELVACYVRLMEHVDAADEEQGGVQAHHTPYDKGRGEERWGWLGTTVHV